MPRFRLFIFVVAGTVNESSLKIFGCPLFLSLDGLS